MRRGTQIDATRLAALTQGRGYERHAATPNARGGYEVIAEVRRESVDYVVVRGGQTTRQATAAGVLATLGTDAAADDWEATA